MQVRQKRNAPVAARWLILILWGGAISESALGGDRAGLDLFESRIRPVLIERCVECHGPEKQKGGLRLDSRAGWVKGGEAGTALVPGDAEKSLLIRALRYNDPDLQMPPKKKGGPLSPAQVADFESWVKMGALDPRESVAKFGGMSLEQARAWWAFQPLAIVGKGAPINSIDGFVGAQSPSDARSPQADKRTLLRRVTYDLTGLPPTVAEMDAFLADGAPDAFGKVVERLLASSAYGEKWGRYWLDVVRYADTAGENSDRPLPHAWRYRNWVIDAFKRDLPYDDFIRQQIAGDLLAVQGPPEQAADKIIATGYLAIARRFGHEIEKDMHLTFEDTLDTVGKSVLGLTIGCARCHDHKYDPISSRDYYGLYGILQSTRFPFTGCEPQPLPRDLVPIPSPQTQARMAEWEKSIREREEVLKESQKALAAHAKVFEQSAPSRIAGGELAPTGTQDVVVGSAQSPEILTMKKGEMLQLSILPRANYGADSTSVECVIAEHGGSGRVWDLTADFLADPHVNGTGMQHGDRYGNRAVWHVFDLVPEPRLLTEFAKNAEKSDGLMVWRGSAPCPSFSINTKAQVLKFVTVTMPPRSVAMHPGPSGGVAVAWESPADVAVTIRGRVTKIDPGGDGIAWTLARRPGIGAALAEQKGAVEAVVAAQKARDDAVAGKPKVELAFAVAEGKPANARLQKKGEPKDPGDEVPRKMLDIFGGETVSPGAGSGRLQLADSFTRGAARNLAARVMVNRIWAGHFGTGIVATPNDFGARGAAPTDKALLDFLAGQFIQHGWSIKAMHRMIVQSATYQRRDFPRRRLTAEELRDTLLVVSGNLDRSPGGPHPFPPESEWKYTQHEPFAAVYDSNRRSVYLMVQRTRRHPFLSLFDGADPNASTPVRSQSIVPTQALYFLNDPFVHAQAKAMAAHLVAAAPDDAARLELATRTLFGRAATAEEKEMMVPFLAETSAALSGLSPSERTTQSWAAWIRVLFSTNELLYVD